MGGDAYFATQALLGAAAFITPTRGEAGAGALHIQLDGDGGVELRCDNVFDIFLESQLTPSVMMLPEYHPLRRPWLRLKAVIVEAGSLRHSQRKRTMDLVAIPVWPVLGK